MSEPSGVWLGEEHRSVEELRARSTRLRNGLIALGLGPGDTIALFARNSFAPIEVTLAASTASIRVVPVNPRATPREVEFLLRDSSARLLIADGDLLAPMADVLTAVDVITQRPPAQVVAAFPGAAEGSPSGPHRDYEDFIASAPEVGGVQLPGSDTSMTSLFYTSGTTGNPKGVLRTAPTADAIEKRRAILEACYGLTADSRGLVTTPLCHMFSSNFAQTALRVGAAVVIMPRFDAEGFLRLVQRHRITNAQMVPTMFVRLLRLPAETRASYDTSSLRHILHTGAPCAPDVKRAMIDWLGPIIWEQYGSTETGVVALCDSREWLAHPGSVGRPFLGSEIRIYGAQGVLPPGETGEVYARMHGTPDFTYLGQPSARADVERDGLVSAGDVGRLDADGYLYLVDRKSDMIISGGNNVYPAEVESQLARHHLVRDCAAFGVADAEYGERVVAAVSLTDGAGPDPSDDLRAFLRTTLADYKVPREFVVLDEVPRDDSGKLRRRQARELYQRHQAKS